MLLLSVTAFDESVLNVHSLCFRLIVHGTVVLPMIYFLCTRRNPLAVIRGISPALLTALVISSRYDDVTQSITESCELMLVVTFIIRAA